MNKQASTSLKIARYITNILHKLETYSSSSATSFMKLYAAGKNVSRSNVLPFLLDNLKCLLT